MSENIIQNGVEFKACGCGCGNPVKPKSNYLPGHDARHKGEVARDVAKRVLDGEFPSVAQALVLFAVLPSEPLRKKAFQMAEKIVAGPTPSKRTPKAPKAAETPTERVHEPTTGTGTMKIGRWEYPARMSGVGKVERNEKRDGSGAWLPVSGNAAQNIDWAN